MYDLAKRSLVFTVATGGLLLTGSAFSPAMAATGLGTAQTPAHAHETGSALSASRALRAATASGSGEAAEKSASNGGAAQPPDLLFPQSAAGAAGASGPGAALAGDPDSLPIDLGRQLCDTVRDTFAPGAAADGACRTDGGGAGTARTPAHAARPECAGAMAMDVLNVVERRTTCVTAEGSASTRPGDSAAGSDGASATAPARGLAPMPIGVPESVPMERAATPAGCADPAVAAEAELAAENGHARGDFPCAPPVGRHRYPGAGSTCTPPPPTCPPTTPPSTPPSPVVTTRTPTPPPPGHLPQTGADVDVALGAAGAALLAGLGLTGASRRRRRAH